MLNSIEIQEKKDGPSNYSFPFFFVIPLGTELVDRENPILCRMLPPSLKISHSQPDSQTITYQIHAVVGYRAKHSAVVSETDERLDTTRTIDFLPYSEAQPPTHVSDFPDEFTLKASSPIWRHVLGGRLGSLNVIASEPLPLAYSPYHDQPTTECALSIVVHAPLAIQRLRTVSLDMSLAIRIKTFYSTEPLPCLPSQALLAQNALVRLHDQTVKLRRKEYTQLDWIYCPRLESTEPPSYERSERDDALGGDFASLGDVAHGDHTWKTLVKVPIEPSVALLPSFCSSFIARSYSLLLHLRVTGIRTQVIDLEVPLQVVHKRPAQVRMDSVHEEGSGSCIGPAGLLAQEKVRYYSPVRKDANVRRSYQVTKAGFISIISKEDLKN